MLLFCHAAVLRRRAQLSAATQPRLMLVHVTRPKSSDGAGSFLFFFYRSVALVRSRFNDVGPMRRLFARLSSRLDRTDGHVKLLVEAALLLHL